MSDDSTQKPEIQEFFTRYADASLNGSPATIAGFYGKSFIMVGPTGSQAFANDDSFLKWLQGVLDFNKQSGLEKMFVRNIDSLSVGKHIWKATVTWGSQFAKTGNRIIEFDLHYLLEKFESGLKIIMYISDEDQEQLMKAHGILPAHPSSPKV
jgi:hypothetical protein